VRLLDGDDEVAETAVTGAGSAGTFSGTVVFDLPAAGLVGVHDYTAEFTSSNAAELAGSDSDPVEVEVYFWDRAPGSSFYTEISWLASNGITTGVEGGGFDPGGLVDRQAMAAFLFRLENPGADKPLCTVTPFPDVPVSNQFCGEIAWLASSGIAAGYDDGTFRPATKIDRQAMAAFLYRVQHPGGAKPTCTVAPFVDVAAGNQFCGEITWLKASGITTGYDGNRFQPGEKISRQAMAAFLYRMEHPTDN